MNERDLVYLRPNVVPEPLFAGWYAWPHLISPATCAMNVVGRHLKIMSSFIQAPQVHAAAVKDPRMLGGPFMDHPESLVDEIKKLKGDTLKSQRHLIVFAEAVRDLYQMLKRDATGYSLDALYEKVPETLKGYVELYYDVQNQPSFRFYEALLYNSQYHDRSAQSLACYSINSDYRPFALSTPRLPNRDTLNLSIPFDSGVIDDLFRMRRKAAAYAEIREALGIRGDEEELFRTFFTDSAPPRPDPVERDGVRVRYFGHACLLIQTREVSILSDPILSYRYDGGMPRYTYDDLPDVIDYVVITHNHQDHILLETLLQIRHKVRNLIVPRNGVGQLHDPNLKLMFRALGFRNVIELDEFETIELPGGQITGLPFSGEHADLGVRAKLCHLVRVGGTSILLLADSSSVESKLYYNIHQLVGDVDVLFLGMECDGAPLTWLYGPLLPEPLARDKDRSRRLAGSDFLRATQLVEQFRPKEVYVYAMGQEPWLTYMMALQYTDQSNPIIASNKLVSACREQGMVAERLFGMKEVWYA
ncbi:MAG TPA: MBL fold metallo-hydrolase [Blastocatellia bacterium]|nr:MBL fold metallo-hydrolase [Blastocatellia bacterium]